MITIQVVDKNVVSEGACLSDTIRVWDIVVRVFHWSLVAIFAALWLTADDFVWAHEILGYGILLIIGFRLVWGGVGGKYARFSNFVKSPSTVIAYLKDMRRGREARYIGHNPVGGAMIIVLLLTLAATGLTGWMSTTDAYWGAVWLEVAHAFLANLSIVLVAAHIIGVFYASRTHNENLAKAMFTGYKRRD